VPQPSTSAESTDARRRLRRLVVVIAVAGLVLSILFLLWATVGVRSVRNALVEETERQSLALLQSLILASQYSLATGTLVDQLEQETLAERTRSILQQYPSGTIDAAMLDSVATRLDADALSLLIDDAWISSDTDVPILQAVAGDELLADLESVDDQIEVSYTDSLAGQTWEGVAFTSPQGVAIVWAIRGPSPSQPAIGGIGELIQEIGRQSGVNYIVLQAPDGIVFASRPLKPLLKLAADSFLVNVLETDVAATREIDFEGTPVIEAAAPFLSTELPSGMFRVGLSLTAVDDAVSRLTVQLGLTALLLVLLSTTVISIAVTRRSLADLGKSYREVETLSASVLDSIDQAVISVDADGKLTSLNPTAERWFRVRFSDVRGQGVTAVLPLDFGLDEVRTKRRANGERETVIQTDHGLRTLIYATAPLVTIDTKHVGAVTVIRDETDARNMAAQVRRAERLSAMGHLAAGVAHEIRNPLNAIALAAQQLKMELGPVPSAAMADTIWSESKRLNKIVEDFLSLARPSTLPKAKLDWRELVESVAQMAALETDKKEVALTLDLCDDCHVDGVADELRKALWNLLRNAIAASDSGGRISLDLRVDSGRVKLSIDDTGSGIAPDALSRVFEPWFTTKSGGTGLGLAITYRIVQDHEGTIEISSPVPGTNRGTRVVVSLPVSQQTG